MSKSITTLLTFLSRLSSSYGNPTEPGLTRSQCSAATHGGGAVKLPVLLKLVLLSEIIQCTDFLMHESHISRPI